MAKTWEASLVARYNSGSGNLTVVVPRGNVTIPADEEDWNVRLIFFGSCPLVRLGH